MQNNLQTKGVEFSKSSNATIFRVAVNFAYGAVFLSCAFLNEYRFTAIVSAILITVYFIDLYRTDKVFLWKFAYVLFSSISYLVGEFVCDFFPTYLSELGIITHYTGAFSALALYYWIFYTVLRSVDKKISRQTTYKKVIYSFGGRRISNTVFKAGGVIIFIFGTILFLQVARNPSFSLGITRFVYAKENLSGLVSKLVYYPSYFCPLILYPLLKNNKESMPKKIIKVIVIYSPYVLFLIWAGHKFGSLWTLFTSIAIPIVFTRAESNNDSISFKRTLFAGGILFGFYFVLLSFYTLRGTTVAEAMSGLAWRTSAQGELWWRMFDLNKNGPLRIEEFFEEIQSVFQSIVSQGSQRHYGVYRLMEMFGNPSVLARAGREGWRYSAGGFELPFYYFKYAAFIITPLFLTPFYSILSNNYIKSVLCGDFISGICILHLIHTFHSAALQGDWLNFTSIDSLVFISILVVIKLYQKRNMHIVDRRRIDERLIS